MLNLNLNFYFATSLPRVNLYSSVESTFLIRTLVSPYKKFTDYVLRKYAFRYFSFVFVILRNKLWRCRSLNYICHNRSIISQFYWISKLKNLILNTIYQPISNHNKQNVQESTYRINRTFRMGLFYLSISPLTWIIMSRTE